MTMPGTGVCWPFSSAHSPLASCIGAVGQDVLLVFEAQRFRVAAGIGVMRKIRRRWSGRDGEAGGRKERCLGLGLDDVDLLLDGGIAVERAVIALVPVVELRLDLRLVSSQARSPTRARRTRSPSLRPSSGPAWRTPEPVAACPQGRDPASCTHRADRASARRCTP